MIKVPAYLAGFQDQGPTSSTTSLLQTYSDETITIKAHQLTRPSGSNDDDVRGQVIARVNPDNNLPTSHAYCQASIPKGLGILNNTITTVSLDNTNPSEAKKELLRWHHRLGHLAFRKIQFLMRSGVLSRRSESNGALPTAACQIVNPPTCAACQYGKQHQRPAPAKVATAIKKDRVGVLKAENLAPGQQVSIDYFICGTKGRLFLSAGKSLNTDMLFAGDCLFIDHATNFVHVKFQKHRNTADTLKAKEKFGALSNDHGVIAQSYLSDNARCFTFKQFKTND